MFEKLDLKELQSVYNKREMAKIPGFMYWPFVPEIIALRLAGVPYRIIAERLNLKVKSRQIEAQALRRLYLKWIDEKFITDSMIEELTVISDNLKMNAYDEDEQIKKVETVKSVQSQWVNV